MSYKLDDFFILLCASRDGTIEFNTANTLSDVIRYLDKPKIAACSDKAGISVARTHLLEKMRLTAEKNNIEHDGTVKALWIDSDVRTVSAPKKIADDIQEADSKNWNLIGNYRGLWEGQTYINTIAKPNENGAYTFYADEELKALQNFQELPQGTVGGLGFAYFRMPMDYSFEFNVYGEDICMWRHMYSQDQAFRLRYWDVELRHAKTVYL